MKYPRFASGFLAIALLTGPAIASAQTYGPNNSDRDQYNGVISAVNGSALALQNGTTVFLHNGTVISPGGTHLEPGMRISITGSRVANGNIDASEIDVVNGGGYGGSGNGYGRNQYYGVISSVHRGSLALENGKTVFLKNNTVINSNGMRLQRGMHISVTGSPAGDGNINAREIDLVNGNNAANYGNNGSPYYVNGNGNNNGSYTRYSGVVSSVSSGAIGLQDGKTVFLKSGTVINPSGTRLQPGMSISVTGSPAGDGNINASEIDLVNGNPYNGNPYNGNNNR